MTNSERIQKLAKSINYLFTEEQIQNMAIELGLNAIEKNPAGIISGLIKQQMAAASVPGEKVVRKPKANPLTAPTPEAPSSVAAVSKSVAATVPTPKPVEHRTPKLGDTVPSEPIRPSGIMPAPPIMNPK